MYRVLWLSRFRHCNEHPATESWRWHQEDGLPESLCDETNERGTCIVNQTIG